MYNTDYPDRADLPSTFRLVRSTFVAAVAAIIILLTLVLPAEYGIDPFRIGGVMGLTQMGEIKMQLAEEAAAQTSAAPGQAVATSSTDAATASLAARVTALEAVIGSLQSRMGGPAQASPVAGDQPVQVAPLAPNVPQPAMEPQAVGPQWRDELSFVLTPGQGSEYKLSMPADGVADYEFNVDGGVINVDVHGEGAGQSVQYEQVRGVSDGGGSLQPPFDGTHGWFFRNRGGADVTVTLRVKGNYTEVRKLS